MSSAPAIVFDWEPSRGWRAFRWGTFVVGALCLMWSGVDIPVKGGIALLAGWLEWRNLRFERAWHGSHWQLDCEGNWNWQRVDGAGGGAVLTQATLLGPLIVLNFRSSDGRIDLPIWPDQLDTDTRRHLRVRLARPNAVAADPARL